MNISALRIVKYFWRYCSASASFSTTPPSNPPCLCVLNTSCKQSRSCFHGNIYLRERFVNPLSQAFLTKSPHCLWLKQGRCYLQQAVLHYRHTHMSYFSCVSVRALCTHFICVGICVRVSIVAGILLSTRLSPPDLLYSEYTVCCRRKEDFVCQERKPLLLKRVFLSLTVWRKSISNGCNF